VVIVRLFILYPPPTPPSQLTHSLQNKKFGYVSTPPTESRGLPRYRASIPQTRWIHRAYSAPPRPFTVAPCLTFCLSLASWSQFISLPSTSQIFIIFFIFYISYFFSPFTLTSEAESKEKTWCVWDPMPELTITSPYAHSRFDSNTFTMGSPMPESTLTLCQSRLYPLVRDFGFRL